ncbi:AHH domain-containing protein [Gallaecimonas kandeliae]|uniref:AHH domain-containing protein n=1 Tax=Gallaecimonas kandeliae TaxID=3029055 RepID=UPI0026481E27|nr:AHH domain-containing protein [Gallaecimonas kandeliae]WKE65423.1 AHH domain-containing protein [Gallaecimonas kandeliae]
MTYPYKPLAAPVRPENPTPLELAIYQFEKRCAEYHSKERAQKVANLSPKEQAKFSENQRLEWEHLQNLKAALIAHDIATPAKQPLADYRQAVTNKTLTERLQEPHHPPKVLARNLEADGDPQPSPRYAPHHIIMGKGRYRKPLMSAARLNLHLHGVGINDSVNGVWLVHNRAESELWRTDNSTGEKPKHWATPDAPVHLPIHTYNYETWIYSQFGPRGIPKESFLRSLKTVKVQLKTGAYPQMIEERPSKDWDGKA